MKFLVYFCAAFLIASAVESRAFSLLGPVQPWMQSSNGVIYDGDIGGPMCISNEYRWNVPVLTYGFDQSFSNYFGTNGIAAVKSAIQILNDLPPASQIVLTNYPFNSQHINFTAQAQNLYDLKSETLSLLLEHMGLAQPTRYLFVIPQWNPIFTNSDLSGYDLIPNYIVQMNYDPQTLDTSPYLDGTLFSFHLNYGGQFTFVASFSVSPFPFSAPVADFSLDAGYFYNGLTYDDVGGLAYLLSTNTVNYETLLPSVVGVGTNANLFVNGAWRPGVNKITFIPQSVNPVTGAFLPMTNQFTDTFITNGNVTQQQLARTIAQPDFLFSVADTGENNISLSMAIRSGTTNWINNATLNGNTNGAGPGVIQPSVAIIFGKSSWIAVRANTDESAYTEPYFFWGTFDGSTNDPIYYPAPTQTGTNQTTVRMWLTMGSNPNYTLNTFQRSFEWPLVSPANSPFVFQTSTNLKDWVGLFTNVNDGKIFTYFANNPTSPGRFYRVVQQ